MAANLVAQRNALDDLFCAYESARDFTLPVLRIAFGDPPPPPDKCVWPPPGLTQREVDSKLFSIQHCLLEREHALPDVLCDIHAARTALFASGFDVPRSYIVPHPLESFRGGMLGVCTVTEIVKSAPAEDAALEKVLGEISVDLELLKGKIAAATQGGQANGNTDSPPPVCPGCGGPIAESDLVDLPFLLRPCPKCRSTEGLYTQLWREYRFVKNGSANPDSLLRHPEWPAIQHYACERFGHSVFTDQTWERLENWLLAEHAETIEVLNRMPIAEVLRLLRIAIVPPLGEATSKPARSPETLLDCLQRKPLVVKNADTASPDFDRRFMEIAVEEARKSKSEDDRVHPMVGAVIVKDGVVLAAAYRGELADGDHAEFTAMEKKLPDATIADATVYATLEPCTTRSHRKLPCALRLVERKVRSVVIGMLDPNPEICGKGVLKLREAGIAVAFFPADLMSEIEEMNREFIQYQRNAAEGNAREVGSPPRASMSPLGRLIQAIDALLSFVRERDQVREDPHGAFCRFILRSEMDEFRKLDTQVFVLAHESGLLAALPKQDELKQQMYSPDVPMCRSNDPDSPPVQFEGKTSLPGDWTPDYFVPVWNGRWKDDMSVLRALAESRVANQTDRKDKRG